MSTTPEKVPVPSRIELQSIVALILVGVLVVFVGVILYLIIDGRITIIGNLDAGYVIGFLLTAVATSLGWIYNKKSEQK